MFKVTSDIKKIEKLKKTTRHYESIGRSEEWYVARN